MFKDYLINNGVKEENIIYINFESALYDDIKNYKDLYNYVKEKVKKDMIYLLLDEVQNVESWERAINQNTQIAYDYLQEQIDNYYGAGIYVV